MDDYDVPERVYSLPILIGGGALVAVLVGIVTAVVIVSQSSAPVAHRKAIPTPAASTSTAIAGPSTPVAPPPLGLQMISPNPWMP